MRHNGRMSALHRLVFGALLLALATLFACSSKEPEQNSSSSDGGAGTPSVILDGGGTIPDPPEGGLACQSGGCNYQTQDCAPGESCLPTDQPPANGDWPPKCFPAGTSAPGQTCSGWNECVAGYFCVGIAQATDGGIVPGTCRKLCCGGDWSACPSGESCFQQVYLVRPGGGDPLYANADICAPVGNCDVFDEKSCAEGRSCKIVDPTGNVACVPSGSAKIGDPCSSVNPCIAGASCVADRCRRLCKAVEGGGTPACPKDEGTCVHFARDPPGVGECTLL